MSGRPHGGAGGRDEDGVRAGGFGGGAETVGEGNEKHSAGEGRKRRARAEGASRGEAGGGGRRRERWVENAGDEGAADEGGERAH